MLTEAGVSRAWEYAVVLPRMRGVRSGAEANLLLATL